MKYLIFFICIFRLSAVGQTTIEPLPDLEFKNGLEHPADTNIYSVVSKPPSYSSGMKGMNEFISNKTKMIEPKLTGTVVIMTIVEINGTLTILKTVKNVPNCAKCEQEVLKIIKAMPPWIPAEYNGEPIRSYFNLAIKLDSQ